MQCAAIWAYCSGSSLLFVCLQSVFIYPFSCVLLKARLVAWQRKATSIEKLSSLFKQDKSCVQTVHLETMWSKNFAEVLKLLCNMFMSCQTPYQSKMYHNSLSYKSMLMQMPTTIISVFLATQIAGMQSPSVVMLVKYVFGVCQQLNRV